MLGTATEAVHKCRMEPNTTPANKHHALLSRLIVDARENYETAKRNYAEAVATHNKEHNTASLKTAKAASVKLDEAVSIFKFITKSLTAE